MSSGWSVVVLVAVGMVGCATVEDDNPFPSWDWDGDGRLSSEEFEAAVVDTVLRFGDSDRDGKITFGEWSTVNPEADPARFAASDTDGDGALSREEIFAAADRVGLRARLMEAADLDRDGWVDIDEASSFRHVLMHSEGSTEMAKVAHWIHR